MVYILSVGLEHLQTGVEFRSPSSSGISFHADGPTTFKAWSLQPFYARWHRAGFDALTMDSYQDSWEPPLPETIYMIRARVERNNVLQRTGYNSGLFTYLAPEKEAGFREWARDHYRPGEPIREVWHPIVQDECHKMLLEAQKKPDAVDRDPDLCEVEQAHVKVPLGQCPVCGHYGADCTGLESDHEG